jgi:protein-tyrosine phosphatase
MPWDNIDLRFPNCDMEAAVCKTVDALRAGKIVVLPTETVYGLAARAYDGQAVQRLIQLKGRSENHPFALAFGSVESISDFGVEMSDLAFRLARRSLPGPVSLILNVPSEESELQQLPKSVQSVVSQQTTKQSTVCCRIPNHLLTLTVLGELNEPIVLTSANRSGEGESANVEQIAAELGGGIDLIVDDGPIVSPKPSTIIRVFNDQYSILREGAISRETVKRLTAQMILFVCTGNTCRSPMAERICEKLLADRLGCSIENLEDHGFVVLSAGLMRTSDQPASSHAVEVLGQDGINLNDHRSQQLKETHVRFADHIFAMTRGHRETILSSWPFADTRLYVLRTDGRDISDPIGNSMKTYQDCAEQIKTEIAKRLNEIL